MCYEYLLNIIPLVIFTDKGKPGALRYLVCRGGVGREDFPEELTSFHLRTDISPEINHPT